MNVNLYTIPIVIIYAAALYFTYQLYQDTKCKDHDKYSNKDYLKFSLVTNLILILVILFFILIPLIFFNLSSKLSNMFTNALPSNQGVGIVNGLGNIVEKGGLAAAGSSSSAAIGNNISNMGADMSSIGSNTVANIANSGDLSKLPKSVLDNDNMSNIVKNVTGNENVNNLLNLAKMIDSDKLNQASNLVNKVMSDGSNVKKIANLAKSVDTEKLNQASELLNKLTPSNIEKISKLANLIK